jgi:transposase InsO family protein
VALDFQFDITADGRTIKLLNIVDEYTREALAIVVDRTIDADQTVTALEKIVIDRGVAPTFIRCDNGPELTAHALADWCRTSGAGTHSSTPARPGRTPGSSRSTPGCETSALPWNSSTRCSKPRLSSRTSGSTTTTDVRTARSACSP